jgi:hypothetical protein
MTVKSSPVEVLPVDAEELVTRGSALHDRLLHRKQASWQGVRRRIALRRRQAAFAAGTLALASLLVAALVTADWRPERRTSPSARMSDGPQWREIDLPGTGRLSLAPGSRARLPVPEPSPEDSYRATLDRGQLCAQVNHRDPVRQGPFVVEAPGLRVSVVGTRFCVFAPQGSAWVAVQEGRVRVEGENGEPVELAAGESLHADDARLLWTASGSRSIPGLDSPAPSLAPTPQHVRRSPEAERSGGLGTLTEAAALRQVVNLRDNPVAAKGAMQVYRNLFPKGALAHEADVLELQIDLTAGDEAAALALLGKMEIDEKTTPDKRRELEVIHGELLARSGRCSAALELFRSAIDEPNPPDVMERAMFGEGSCLLTMGLWTESRKALTGYLDRFPKGRFRGQALADLKRARLGSSGQTSEGE